MRTITITIPDEVAEALEAEADAAGRDLSDLAGERLTSALNSSAPVRLPGRGAPNTAWQGGQPVYVPPAPPPWLTDVRPDNPPTDGTNGLHRVVGRWPGDETDEEVAAALERLS